MPSDVDAVPVLDVASVLESMTSDVLTADLEDSSVVSVGCPRQAPTSGVVKYTYAQWFQPYSAHRRYCQLPVSSRNMQRFLQFRLGCHNLPIAAGRHAGVVRASRHCIYCSAGALGDEKHLVFECASLVALRAEYADLFTTTTPTMRSFVAQSDHLRVFRYVIEHDERIVIATRSATRRRRKKGFTS